MIDIHVSLTGADTTHWSHPLHFIPLCRKYDGSVFEQKLVLGHGKRGQSPWNKLISVYLCHSCVKFGWCLGVCMCACMCVCMHICVYVCICVHVRMYVYVYVCTYVCMYICMYVWLAVWIHACL